MMRMVGGGRARIASGNSYVTISGQNGKCQTDCNKKSGDLNTGDLTRVTSVQVSAQPGK